MGKRRLIVTIDPFIESTTNGSGSQGETSFLVMSLLKSTLSPFCIGHSFTHFCVELGFHLLVEESVMFSSFVVRLNKNSKSEIWLLTLDLGCLEYLAQLSNCRFSFSVCREPIRCYLAMREAVLFGKLLEDVALK